MKDNFAKDPVSTQKALEKLNRIYFTYTLKSDGTAAVTHEGDFGEASDVQKRGSNRFTAAWSKP